MNLEAPSFQPCSRRLIDGCYVRGPEGEASERPSCLTEQGRRTVWKQLLQSPHGPFCVQVEGYFLEDSSKQIYPRW